MPRITGPGSARPAFGLTVAATALLAVGTAGAQSQPSAPPSPLPPIPSVAPQPRPEPATAPNPPPVAPTAPTLPQPPRGPQAPGIGLPQAPPTPTIPPVTTTGGLPGTVTLGSFTAAPMVPRFTFKIDPNTPLKDLLPAAPKTTPPGGPVTSDDLARVPEVEFRADPGKPASPEGMRQVAHQIAKANHLNAKQTDGFLAALREHRPDLAGLPFAMGDDCRTKGEPSRQFTAAVALVRQALNGRQVVPPAPQAGGLPQAVAFSPNVAPVPPPIPGGFWPTFTNLCDQQDGATSRTDRELPDTITRARIAALMQVLATESPEMRTGLVKHLAGVTHPEATRALARLALFSPEDEVRSAAINALKVRREKDYSDLLLAGLKYPFPAVAKRAADAIAKLERTDLIPELVAVLDRSDPRAPVAKEVGGEKVAVVREVVRVNHHKSCLMCHAPAVAGTVGPDTPTAPVPAPGEPLSPPNTGYQQSAASPDLMIRLDVTYLRQDFSVLLPVTDAHPWPEMQRFDFLVRERTLTDAEAAAFESKLAPKGRGVLSPYHRAALAALREMTGKDAAPTAAAWRELLELPPKADGTAGRR